MKKNNEGYENLNDFLEETENVNKKNTVYRKETTKKHGTYICPKCNKTLNNRFDECPNCHYKGYIPMNEQETKRIRAILFFIFLVIAIVVYIIVYMNK